MATTRVFHKSGKFLTLWLCTGLIGTTAMMPQAVNAEDNGRNNGRNYRNHQHVYPKKNNHRGGNHYGWRNAPRYEQRCTTRAVRTWDMLWGEYRTHYVRQCW